MAKVTLYTALSNVTAKRTPEFVAASDADAELTAKLLLNCRADEVVLVHEEVDRFTDAWRIARAKQVGMKHDRN